MGVAIVCYGYLSKCGKHSKLMIFLRILNSLSVSTLTKRNMFEIRYKHRYQNVSQNSFYELPKQQDGDVSDEEFVKAVQKNCMGKPFDQLPPGFQTFITNQYNSVDVDGN